MFAQLCLNLTVEIMYSLKYARRVQGAPLISNTDNIFKGDILDNTYTIVS